jgi:GNAT acetyltransferase-like protein
VSSAELLPDRGRGSEAEEFFRSAQFLAAEGTTHTLVIRDDSGGEALVPLVVRDVPGTDLRDASSPYAYPGASGTPVAVEPGAIDWSPTGLVSVFIRDRVGAEPCLPGATVRSGLLLADPRSRLRIRKTYRQEVRRNIEAGFATELLHGPATSAHERAAFLDLYTQTMRRAAAGERYLFSDSYVEAVLGSEATWLVLTRGPAGEPASAAIAARSDGMLHYFLSGTADTFQRRSPSKNGLMAMIDLAAELGMPLNLGGGAAAGDSLESFKRGFSNATAPFHTHEIVCDAAAYARLLAGRPGGDYFPAYRSGERV